MLPAVTPLPPQAGMALSLAAALALLLLWAPRRSTLGLLLLCLALAWSQRAWDVQQDGRCRSAELPAGLWAQSVRVAGGVSPQGEVRLHGARLSSVRWGLPHEPAAGQRWTLLLWAGSRGCSGVQALGGWLESPAGPVPRLRTHLADALQRGAGPGWHREAALARAMALGDGAGLGNGWEVLRRTQTLHVAVVSGLHMSTVAGLAVALALLLARLSPRLRARRRRLALVAALLAALAFGTLAGWPVSAQRAALMGAIAAAATLFRVQPLPLPNLLAACLLGLLLVDPVAASKPGSWLSLGLVGAILALPRLARKDGVRLWSLPGLAHGLLALLRLQLSVFAALVALGAVMELPVTAASVPINLVAVPLASLAVVSSLAAMLPALLLHAWESLWPASPGAEWLQWTLRAALLPARLLWGWIELADGWFGHWPTLWFPNLFCALAAALAGFLALLGRPRLALAAGLIAALAWLWPSPHWSLDIAAQGQGLELHLRPPWQAIPHRVQMCVPHRRPIPQTQMRELGPGLLWAGVLGESCGFALLPEAGLGTTGLQLQREFTRSRRYRFRLATPPDGQGQLGALSLGRAGRMYWRPNQDGGGSMALRRLHCRLRDRRWLCAPRYLPWWARSGPS